METTGSNACTRGAVATTRRQLNVIKRSLYVCSHRRHSARSDASQYKGMLVIPPELLVIISAYMDHQDLRAFALTSRFLCHLLLPEYLRRRGLALKDTSDGGKCVEVYDLSGCASLGLWSIVPTFRPPEEMYFSIPHDSQEARSAIGFVTRFLLNSSNTSSLRSFHCSLLYPDLLPIMPELIKMQDLFCVLPLARLHISGFGWASHLPPSIPLRSGMTYGSRTLSSLVLSSDHAFTPGLVRTTLGILKQSPIKSLAILMVSLKPSHWSTLLGQLNMSLLEDIELEGDIPRSALLRFLIKHRGIKIVRIAGSASSPCAQPSRSQNQHFLPNLRSLHAPSAICCAILRRASDPSRLRDLHVELSRLHPHDPSFRDLLKALRHFQKLTNLGLQLVPSSLSAVPQLEAGPGKWDGHPVSELTQIRTLSFSSLGLLSLEDIVCLYLLLVFLALLTSPHMIGHDMCLCTIIPNARSSTCVRRRDSSQN